MLFKENSIFFGSFLLSKMMIQLLKRINRTETACEGRIVKRFRSRVVHCSPFAEVDFSILCSEIEPFFWIAEGRLFYIIYF